MTSNTLYKSRKGTQGGLGGHAQLLVLLGLLGVQQLVEGLAEEPRGVVAVRWREMGLRAQGHRRAPAL